MIKVSVHNDIELPAVARKYAHALQSWKNGGSLPSVFGNEGQWEDSGRLRDSFVLRSIFVYLMKSRGLQNYLPPHVNQTVILFTPAISYIQISIS